METSESCRCSLESIYSTLTNLKLDELSMHIRKMIISTILNEMETNQEHALVLFFLLN